MHRHFGLGHISPRCSSQRKLSLGANAGASFFTWKAAAKRVYDRFSKRDRASAQPVSVHVIYLGRVLFAHGEQNCTPDRFPSHPVEVKS
jgi:hypothetical protein